MSKIDIDKFFRDKFHEHESNPAGNKQGDWNKFEQLLDDKKGGGSKFSFSFSQWLLLLSAVAILVIIPILYFNFKDGGSSLTKAQNIIVGKRQITPVRNAIPKKKCDTVIKNIALNSAPLKTKTKEETNANNKKQNTNINKDAVSKTEARQGNSAVSMPSKMENISSNVGVADKNNNKQNPALPARKDSTALAKKADSASKNTNKKAADTTKKPKTIKRTKVLLPKINYNGF